MYRTAGLIIDGERVLLRKVKKGTWTPPAGKVKIGEDSEAALRRILAAELSQQVEIDRLVWVVENQTDAQGDEPPCHEISLYYLAHLPSGSPWIMQSEPLAILQTRPGKKSHAVEYCWLPLDRTKRLTERIMPGFLDEALAELVNSGYMSVNLGTKIWGVSGTIKIKA